MSAAFVRLVLIAFVMAAPVAWWVTNRWLEAFAYRVSVGPGTLLGAGLIALALAVLTVGVQSFRTASVDPVTVLRYE